MAIRKLNLTEAFASFDECWQPREAGRVNNCAVKLAKLDGDFIWHHHEHEDELFLVVEGALTMHVRDDGVERAVDLAPGEMIIIPRGVEHKPEAPDGCSVLLFEPASTLNTGNIESERTVRDLKSL